MKKFLIILLGLLVFMIIAFSICGKKNLQHDYFTVSEIVSGNQIKLTNGYEVILIGIEDNEKTRNFLEKNILNKEVKFNFDSKCPFSNNSAGPIRKSFYAYVYIPGKYCINSKLLKNHLSVIQYSQPCLNDSIVIYQRYSGSMPFNDPNNIIKPYNN